MESYQVNRQQGDRNREASNGAGSEKGKEFESCCERGRAGKPGPRQWDAAILRWAVRTTKLVGDGPNFFREFLVLLSKHLVRIRFWK
jgi:hypothetical protein